MRLNSACRLPHRGITLLVFLGYCAFILYTYAQGHHQAAAGETPFFNDFTSTYAASQLLREGPAEHLYLSDYLYPAELAAANEAYGGELSEHQARAHGYAAWLYPPLFMLICLPLAFFPYLVAQGFWLGATALPYVLGVRAILPWHQAGPLLLAAPPTFLNLIYGQTGFLSAGFIGLGLAWLWRFPTAAGVLLGLAAFKPQFGVLIPFALAAGRFGWPFFAASATLVAFIAATVIAFGAEPWWAFLGTQVRNFAGFEAGAYNLAAMVTPFSLVRSLGAEVATAAWLQGAASLLMLVLVLWLWGPGRHRDPERCLRPALLCSAALVATPMAYLYDMTLLLPAAAWLLKDIRARGGTGFETPALVLALAAILALKPLAEYSGLALGAGLSLAWVGLVLWRTRQTRGTAFTGGMHDAS